MGPFDLTGRTALVTGASRGIGAACALALARHGARVALAARSTEGLDEVAVKIGGDAVVLPTDLRASGAADALAAAAIDALGHVDVLVNNAGMSQFLPTRLVTEAQVDEILALNLRAVLVLSSRIGAHMAERGSGSIVNMSSRAATVSSIHMAAYAATKGGLDSLTLSMAGEWGPKGVRVNGVAPGIIHTDMWDAGLKLPGLKDNLEAHTALRRIGTADEVADVVVFLASEAARFVTGQTIDVDGGLPFDGVMPRME